MLEAGPRAYMRSGMKASSRAGRENLRPDLGLETVGLILGLRANFGPKKPIFDLRGLIWGQRGLIWGLRGLI